MTPLWTTALLGSGRAIAMIAAIALMLLGLVMVAFNERTYNDQKAREIGVQAQIISASVAPALMFSDNGSAAQYLQALSANPGVSAAAVYDSRGARIATYNRRDEPQPPATAAVHAPYFENSSIVAVTPVYRDGQVFGAVYLRTDAETPLRRFSRYAGVGVLILLAALVLTVLGLAQGGALAGQFRTRGTRAAIAAGNRATQTRRRSAAAESKDGSHRPIDRRCGA